MLRATPGQSPYSSLPTITRNTLLKRIWMRCSARDLFSIVRDRILPIPTWPVFGYTHPMKTLVTGATGFIGSAVVRKLLARERQVRCYVEPRAPRSNLDGLDVEVIEGDINDRAAIGRALDGCGTLYHLAAIYQLWL